MLQNSLDGLFVVIWHFVVLISHLRCVIKWITRDFSQNLDERRNFNFLSLTSCLNSQNARRPIHIRASLYHKVLSLVNKALPNFSDHDFRGVLEISQLNVLPRCDLPLLRDLLIVLDISDLMRVDERIMFADLFNQIRDDSIHVLPLHDQEALSDMEELLLYFKVLWHFQIVVVFVNHDQELFDNRRRRWKTDEIQKGAQALINFF